LTRHLWRRTGLAALAAVSQADIRAWLASLANEGLVNASLRGICPAVRSFLRLFADIMDWRTPR